MAAAEQSANNESPNAKKLKVTNPDPDVSDDWETVEKPEDFLADEHPKVNAAEDTKAPIAEKSVDDDEFTEIASGGGTSRMNPLLKDW